ncbi:MAG: hypothetical protein PHD95_03780 [Candidatus ainarchaeum sp.]|nr:hypothetical protein [Candidatus ainarchaeum sp.]
MPRKAAERKQVKRGANKGWSARKKDPSKLFDTRQPFAGLIPGREGIRKSTATRIDESKHSPYANNAAILNDIFSLQPGEKPLQIKIWRPIKQKQFFESVISFEAKEIPTERKIQLARRIRIRSSDIGRVFIRRTIGNDAAAKPVYYLELKNDKGTTALYRVPVPDQIVWKRQDRQVPTVQSFLE